MAVADLADYIARLGAPHQQPMFGFNNGTVVANRPHDSWIFGVPVGAAPTTAVAPTNATPGAMGVLDAGAAALGILGMEGRPTFNGVLVLCDRLSHNGGMDATSTGVRTTNSPTAALTRYTSGEGVMLAARIDTQVGTTATTLTCSYTNSAGTAGRVSPLTTFGGTGFREAGRHILMPLAEGDTGVRSVENYTLTGSTTTVGAYGFTLFKPLAMFAWSDANPSEGRNLLTGGMSLPAEILDGACLFWMYMSINTNFAGGGRLLLTEW